MAARVKGDLEVVNVLVGKTAHRPPDDLAVRSAPVHFTGRGIYAA